MTKKLIEVNDYSNVIARIRNTTNINLQTFSLKEQNQIFIDSRSVLVEPDFNKVLNSNVNVAHDFAYIPIYTRTMISQGNDNNPNSTSKSAHNGFAFKLESFKIVKTIDWTNPIFFPVSARGGTSIAFEQPAIHLMYIPKLEAFYLIDDIDHSLKKISIGDLFHKLEQADNAYRDLILTKSADPRITYHVD